MKYTYTLTAFGKQYEASGATFAVAMSLWVVAVLAVVYVMVASYGWLLSSALFVLLATVELNGKTYAIIRNKTVRTWGVRIVVAVALVMLISGWSVA